MENYIAIEIAINVLNKNEIKMKMNTFFFNISLTYEITLAAYIVENVFLFLDESNTLSM